MKKKRVIAFILSCTVLCSFASCKADGGQKNDLGVTAEQTTETAEIKTIIPPEDGWTIEELNDVMYLNGEKFYLPYPIDEINDNFELVSYYQNEESIIWDVIFNGEFAFLLKGNQSDTQTITEIAFPNLGYEADIPRDKLFVINGFELTNSLDDLEAALGKPTIITPNSYKYQTTDQKYDLGFIFSDEKSVTSMYITYMEEEK